MEYSEIGFILSLAKNGAVFTAERTGCRKDYFWCVNFRCMIRERKCSGQILHHYNRNDVTAKFPNCGVIDSMFWTNGLDSALTPRIKIYTD